MPSSMFTSRRFAPPRTWSSATLRRLGVVAGLDQPREPREPVTFVRSPIIWKLLSGRIVSVSRPENCVNPADPLAALRRAETGVAAARRRDAPRAIAAM